MCEGTGAYPLLPTRPLKCRSGSSDAPSLRFRFRSRANDANVVRVSRLCPRAITQIWPLSTLVFYSKTKLRRGCSGVSLSEFFPHQTDIPVPIGDSRRPNGTASTPHHGISRRHRIGKYRQTENIRQFFVTAIHTAEIFLANLPSHPDPKTGPLIQTSRLSPVLRLFYLFDISFIRRRFAIPEVAPLRRCCC